MEVRLSHIAIACPEIASIAEKLKVLTLTIAEKHDVPSEKVIAAMVPVQVSEHLRIELLEPSAPDSPLASFLTKRPNGGLHHLCFEVARLERWKEVLISAGIEVLSPGIRKAARGRALFIHPRCMGGVLVELEEIEPAKG
jgi:methylmalonyl-CoA/ethylmalonyl-CoA epimerase